MYTIKEVADKMEISEHTLRFCAKSGFFPFINSQVPSFDRYRNKACKKIY